MATILIDLMKGLVETLMTKSTWLNILIIYISSVSINYRNRLCDGNDKCGKNEIGYTSAICLLVFSLLYIVMR